MKNKIGCATCFWKKSIWEKPAEATVEFKPFDLAVLMMLGIFGNNLTAKIGFGRDTGITDEKTLQGVIAFGVTAVMGAIVEELIFRRILLERLRPYGNVFAVVAIAFIFGMMHLGGFVSSFCFGLVAGVLYVGTGNILWPLLLHIAVNSWGSFLLLGAFLGFGYDGKAQEKLYFIFFVIAVLGFILSKNLKAVFAGILNRQKQALQANKMLYKTFFTCTGMLLLYFVFAYLIFCELRSLFFAK